MLGRKVDERAEAASKGRHGGPYLKADAPRETVKVLTLDPQGKQIVATLRIASDADVSIGKLDNWTCPEPADIGKITRSSRCREGVAVRRAGKRIDDPRPPGINLVQAVG
jgi:hypothetical protein